MHLISYKNSHIISNPFLNFYDMLHHQLRFTIFPVKVKVKLRFSAPSAGIAEIEQT